MKHFIVIQILLFSIISFGSSQFENFISFSTGNGRLTHNTVEAIARDSFGYMWVGTNYGLNRLDGYQNTNFFFDPNNPNSISSNLIKALYVDSENELWVGTINGGLNKFDREKNGFIRFVPSKSAENISSLNISAIVEDKQGDIWIGTIGNGVNRYNKKTGKFKQYDLEKHDPDHRINSNVNKLFCDAEGNIWVGLNQSEVFKIDPVSEKITFFGLSRSNEGYSEVGSIKGIAQLKNGTILISSWSGNLYQLNPATDNQIKLFVNRRFFDGNFLTDIVVDSNDNIWISTWEKGLYKTDALLKEKTVYQRNQYLLNSLGSNSINTLYIDKLNNLCIGFTDNGLSMLSLREKIFKTLSIQSSATSLPDEINVYSIIRDNNNNLWIGARGQGLIKYNLLTKKSKTYSSENYPGLNSNSILTLRMSTNEKIWVGTDGSFLSLFDPATEKFTQVKNLIDDWSGAVFCIADNDQFVWCGTWGGGVKKVDKKTLAYQSINFDDKDQFRNTIFDLEMRDSVLWIANIGIGLIRYNIQTGSKKIYSQSEGFNNFPKERIIDLFFENDSICLISTDGAGLFRFNTHTEKFDNITHRFPLTGNNLQSAVTDSIGKLWIASITGVSCIDITNGKSYNFDRNNGLINNQLNKSAMFFDSIDNVIYTGGVEGVNYFNPYQLFIDSTSNRVVITDLKIMGKSIVANSKSSSLPIDITKQINLFRKDKIVTIHFSSLEFNPSLKNKYQYRLDGFEEEWNETPFPKNFVQYTNLFPGTYYFKVKAVNNDGILSANETSLKIVVHPAFWQTFLFKISVIVLIILSVFLYFKKRYENLVSAKIKLEEKVKQRTAEIQKQKEKIEHQNSQLERANRSKDKFFSIISHDLRNPVTTIDQMAGLIILQYNEVSEEKFKHYLQLLKKSSEATLELLDDLLVWARTQTNRIEIKKTEFLIQDIFENVLITCRPLAEKKNIEIVLPQTNDRKVIVDKYTINTVLRNLITNAIKFSQSDSAIILSVEETDNSFIFHVSDSGIGMKEEEVEGLFKIEKLHSKQGTSGETGSGLGLILCHEFLALNGESIWVKSKQGEGSTFSFTIKKPEKL